MAIKRVGVLQLPSEITFKILEFIIPECFYCPDVSDESKLMEIIQQKSGIQLNLKVYHHFEEMKNYLMIHRDLFYSNFINLHCNRHFLIIWKRILFLYEFEYNRSFKNEINLSDELLELIRETKTGDEKAAQKLISAVFSRFNSPECALQTFFGVKGTCWYHRGDIITDLLNLDSVDWNENMKLLEKLLRQFPSLTLNPLYSKVIILKVHRELISKHLYTNIIKMLKRNRDKSGLKKQDVRRLEQVLTFLFEKISQSEKPMFSKELVGPLSICLAAIKMVYSKDLYEKLFEKWILSDSTSESLAKLKMFLFETPFSGDYKRFNYCLIESYLLSNQFKELENIFNLIGSKVPIQLVSNAIVNITSTYITRIDLDSEISKQHYLDLILSCWNLKHTFTVEDFNDLLRRVTSIFCNRALQEKDSKQIVELYDALYFTFFSKKFIGGHLAQMEWIILQSNILIIAIESVEIFEHLMNNVSNQKIFKKQLNSICKDSSVFYSIISLSVVYFQVRYAHFDARLRTESPHYDTMELYERRLRIVKQHLANDNLFKNSVMDKSSKFNAFVDTLENMKHRFDWEKTVARLKAINESVCQNQKTK